MLVPRSAFAARKICDLTSSRYALGAVQFERDENGIPFAVATDGRRLIALTWPEDKADEFPASEIDLTPNPKYCLLIPAAACDQAAKAKPGAKSKMPILQNVAIGENAAGPLVPMLATDVQSTARFDTLQQEGRFPRWRDVVPQLRTDDIHVRFDADLLRGLLEVVSTHAGSDVCEVVLSFNREKPADVPVVISAQNPGGAAAVGVLMPRRGDEKKPVLPAFTLHRLLSSEPEAAEAATAESAPEVIAVDLEPAPEVAAEGIAEHEPSPALEVAELPPPPREITQPTKAPGTVKPRRVQNWRDAARAVSLAAFV